MSILSIVTVREGSKGLENKCMKRIDGKSVFEYTIEYSTYLNSMMKEEVCTVVSSDSEIIKNYCSRNNIHFIKRSRELSSDSARIEDVIYDAYCKIERDFDYISLLYGNIPIRYPDEFLKAYQFLTENKDYDCALSMKNVEKFNPAWMFEWDEDILPQKKSKGYRRQDLKHLMIHDGHTILFRTKHFLEFMEKVGLTQKKGLYDAFGKKIKPMLNERVIIDIDTEKDIELTKAFISYRSRKERG